MEYKSELIPRILRDIDDSVLALDGRGHVMEVFEMTGFADILTIE